jgi:hypothetical protein
MLAQQASDYDVGERNFHIQEKPMHKNLEFSRAGTGKSVKPTALVGLADPLMDASQLAKLIGPVGLANSHVVGPANLPEKLLNQPDGTSSHVRAD